MGKKEYKQELEQQLKSRQTTKWVSVIFITMGILLTFSIIFAIVGVPMLIIALIVGYRAESKQKALKLEILKL